MKSPATPGLIFMSRSPLRRLHGKVHARSECESENLGLTRESGVALRGRKQGSRHSGACLLLWKNASHAIGVARSEYLRLWLSKKTRQESAKQLGVIVD